ncbi:hypothetical protein BGW36DRAFT_377578 [Talaromyces proteolyticus]|uniref:Zn(2)-C6 fungal-type domain-containing protein n=1 Tax=Talaromyces proteolyticus TaxID=1131652 RepID=A0AAD4KUU9_9EURO|nr:uncharacterized protein BGW36DRAFT_377578 [Talaromyces proteolyticus]KAH8699250.1 hypothetical protein BGW36DRAFT_377578 [Talaromyces proteolyticus]
MNSQASMSAVKRTYKPARRFRVPLSCDSCRTRKLKCNRERPCQNCTVRQEQSDCKYENSKNAYPLTDRRDEHKDKMQQRIDHLEDLVKKFITKNERVPPSSSNTVYSFENSKKGTKYAIPAVESDVSYSTDTTVIDEAHSVYGGANDWYDVLQEINSLKRIWNQTQDDQVYYQDIHPSISHNVDGSSLLFAQVKPIEKMEILSTLPPKSEIDKLICLFFDRTTFPISVPPILHEPTFMREYSTHWKDPSETSIIWLGLLFSILGINMLAYHRFGEPPEYEGISESLFQLYRMRTAQCLLIGDIAKCLPYTLETLRFNATAELNRREDNSRGLWIMTGVIVRVAINMGYHRDPFQNSTRSSISAFHAEYRRRVWLSVISMDNMASFLGGFPRMIPAIYTDTAEPRNIYDWELSDCHDINLLPPSRPLTEPTAVTYLIIKGRLSQALGRVADFNSNPQLTYDAVLDIDSTLREVHQCIPNHMKFSSDTMNSIKSYNEGTYMDFSNLNLEVMYHKGMCTLHRKFMAKGRQDPRHSLSRSRCISSALALIGCQNLLGPSWYQFAHVRQTITLAAMVLFLELELRRRGSANVDVSSHTSSALLQALEKSCALWETTKSSCSEACRIHNILSRMLSSFQTVEALSKISDAASNTDIGLSQKIITPEPSLEEFPASRKASLQLINGIDGIPWEKDFFAMPNEMDFDWNTWDSFIEEMNFEDRTIL